MTRRVAVLVALTSLSTTTSVAGLVIAGKIHQLGPGLAVPFSMWLFPLIFVFGNIVTEVYGKQVSRWLVICVFGCTVIAMAYYTLAVLAPMPSYWQHQESFRVVLGMTPRILLASLVAYVVVANVGILTMAGIKRMMHGRWLWFRVVVTAAITQTLDSLLFVGIAFALTVPWPALLSLAVTSSAIKFVMQLIAVPLSYAVVGFVKEKM